MPQILIVEDSETQALKLAILLENEGWETMWASTAEKALEMVRENPPNLVIVDYFLPGMRGDAFCRQLRMRGIGQIPILMLTIGGEGTTELQGLDSGADIYLSKSESDQVLLLHINSLLRQSVQNVSTGFIRPARLLAIDDSPTYLAFLEEELLSEGYQVTTATNGQEGLTLLQSSEPFDCLLVDLIMPEMDGIEVCCQVNEMRQQFFNPLMVIMLTAHDQPQELAKALEAGADDFVGKSSDISVLKGRIRALLRRKFFQEENQRLLQEVIDAKEQEAQHARRAQKEAEARAALAEKLQETVIELQRKKNEIEQFAYVSAHDLQEPLRTLVNYTELLAAYCGDQLDNKARGYMGYLNKSAQQMKHKVKGLLTYVNLGVEASVFQTVDCQQALKKAQQALAVEFEIHDVTLDCEPLPLIAGDVNQITLLFHHLLQNALKFRGEKPPHIQIAVKEQARDWLFSMKDNGLGIEPQYTEKIFKIFQRLHGQEEYTGAGIGLALCQKIVENHRGRIWVESESDKGSTFYWILPKTHESS